MSINRDFYYTYKRRFEEAIKEVREEERAWLLENLAKELLNDLASEWLSRNEYEKEVGILKEKEFEVFDRVVDYLDKNLKETNFLNTIQK